MPPALLGLVAWWLHLELREAVAVEREASLLQLRAGLSRSGRGGGNDHGHRRDAHRQQPSGESAVEAWEWLTEASNGEVCSLPRMARLQTRGEGLSRQH